MHTRNLQPWKAAGSLQVTIRQLGYSRSSADAAFNSPPSIPLRESFKIVSSPSFPKAKQGKKKKEHSNIVTNLTRTAPHFGFVSLSAMRRNRVLCCERGGDPPFCPSPVCRLPTVLPVRLHASKGAAKGKILFLLSCSSAPCGFLMQIRTEHPPENNTHRRPQRLCTVHSDSKCERHPLSLCLRVLPCAVIKEQMPFVSSFPRVPAATTVLHPYPQSGHAPQS